MDDNRPTDHVPMSNMHRNQKRRREDEEERETEDFIKQPESKKHKLYHLTSLRNPIRNCIPNYFVPRKLTDKRGRKRKNKSTKSSNRPEGEQQANSPTSFLSTLNNGTNHNSLCTSCNNNDLSRFIKDTQGCPVCQDCGTVQVSEMSFEDECWQIPEKNSQGYQRRSYIGERLRQFSGTEPRIPEQDLEVIRFVYASLRKAYHSDHPLFKRRKTTTNSNPCISTTRSSSEGSIDKRVLRLSESFTDREEDLTKENIKTLLDFIDSRRTFPEQSFKKKYLERWAQIKRYFCGDNYYHKHISPKPSHYLMDYLYKMATLVAIIYENDELLEGYILKGTSRYSDIVEYEDEDFIRRYEKKKKKKDPPGCIENTISTLESILFGGLPPAPQEEEEIKIPRVLHFQIPTKKRKRNIPSLDLLFLMLLFTYDELALEINGWYFVRKIMHEYVFKLPGSILSSVSNQDGLESLLKEREKKRSPKYTALRGDFIILKKILTYIHLELPEILEEISTQREDARNSFTLPKNIAEILFIVLRNPETYQFKEASHTEKEKK